MTAAHPTPTLVQRLAAEFDQLPLALVQGCVDAATPRARDTLPGRSDIEDAARRDLAGLAEALLRRDATAGR